MAEEFREEIAKLLVYHENHLDFYKCVWQKAQLLESCSSIFKNTVIHLIERSEINAELATIASLIEKLKDLSGNVLVYEAMNNLKEFDQKFSLPFDDPTDNQLFTEVFNVLRNEEELFQYVFNASAIIRKALFLIEMIDLSSQTVNADIAGKRQIERFLLLISEVIDEASVEARVGAELVQFNERGWVELAEKVRNSKLRDVEAEEEIVAKCHQSRLDLDLILRILSSWAKKFSRALFQYVINIENGKFLRWWKSHEC